MEIEIAAVGKTGDRPEISLRCIPAQGNSQNTFVLIFSQSWSGHGLETPATNDLRSAAMKLNIKGDVIEHKSSFRLGGRNLKVAKQYVSITSGKLCF